MNAAEVDALHALMMEEDFAESLTAEDDDADVLEDVSYDMSDDLGDLVESEATLSEGFKTKAATIMEMAVKSKVREEISRLEESYEEQLAEATAGLTDQIDSYLNYVVENWMEENKVAIETGLRTEIAENFMSGMKDLFTESYITVPEEKVDLVDDLAERNESLEAENNKLLEDAIAAAAELEGYQREAIILEMADDLADTQLDKLAKLSEDVAFTDEDSFRGKMAHIKETYFGKKAPTKTPDVISENVDAEDTSEVEVSETMASYVTALKKSAK